MNDKSSIFQERICARCKHWIGDRNDGTKLGICNYPNPEYRCNLTSEIKPIDFPTVRSFSCRNLQFEDFKTLHYQNGKFEFI
jgi:hypothetical protein